MKLFTEGQLHVTPVRIAGADIELAEIAARLEAKPYVGRPPMHGWGGIPYSALGDPDERPVSPTRASGHGRPSVHVLQDGREVCLARYFFDERDRSLVRRLGKVGTRGVEPEALYRFDAIDVVFVPDELGIVVYLASRDAAQVELVLSDLKASLDADGVIFEHPALDLAPPRDLFLWLISRWETNTDLGSGLSLTEYRSVSAVDSSGVGESRILKYVAMDRPELLALVATRGSEFGPAKFSITDNVARLAVDVFLLLDGRYEITVSASFRLGPKASSAAPLDLDMDADDHSLAQRPAFGWPGRANFGIEVALAVADTILPKLYQAYREDESWRGGGRETFIVGAGASLIRHLQR